MQLGNILSTAQDPISHRLVSFHVLAMTGDGKQAKVKAQAALAFVSEAERQESKRLAARTRKAEDDAEEEEYYWFLLFALRDAEDPTRVFCTRDPQGLSALKSALVLEQVQWLLRQYRAFVKDEYSELLPPEEQEALIEEARGK